MALRQENELLRKADMVSLPGGVHKRPTWAVVGFHRFPRLLPLAVSLSAPLNKSLLAEGVVSVSGFSFSELKEFQSGPWDGWREASEKAANISLHLVPHIYSCWPLSPYQPLCRAKPALLCGYPNVSGLSELCIFVFANQLSFSEGRGAC